MIYRSKVTVLEPADSYDLTTVENVKHYFGVPIMTDDPNDARLQALITLQSKVIADYCDRVFAKEKVSEKIYVTQTLSTGDATTVTNVPLHRWPVISIESATRDGTSLVEGDDFVVDNESGTLRGTI